MITKRADLFELVGDIEDRGAFGLQLIEGLKQDLDLLGREHRGWLVHDQKLGVLQQAADDFDALTFPCGEIANGAIGVERQAVGLADLADAAGKVGHRRWVFHPQRHVFGHIERVKQGKVLKHHGHAGGAGHFGLGWGVGLTLPVHGAAVRFDEPVDHFHQSGFACAVFAQKRVNFAFADGEGHILIGHHAGVGFGHALNG